MIYKQFLKGSRVSGDCGNEDQTIRHIITECALRKFNQGIKQIQV